MTKSKCCGAGLSGYGGMTPLGSTKITYFCGACGKPCELTDAKPEGTEAELSDNEWCAERANLYDVGQYVRNGQSEQFTAIRLQDGLAEGRRREREQIQKEILPEWAEKRLQQREEAAAREMAEMIVKDCQYRSLDMSVEWLMQEFKKRKKSQGGLGL